MGDFDGDAFNMLFESIPHISQKLGIKFSAREQEIIRNTRKTFDVMFLTKYASENPNDDPMYRWYKAHGPASIADFANTFDKNGHKNYTHELIHEAPWMMEREPLGRYSADTQESLNAEAKRARERHTNNGGGKTGKKAKWPARVDWMFQFMAMRVIRQRVVFSLPVEHKNSFLAEEKRKQAKKLPWNPSRWPELVPSAEAKQPPEEL
jgi:hypothetical protein